MPALIDRCIFCGEKTKLSGEHSFWPNWSRHHIPRQPKLKHVRAVYQSPPHSRIAGLNHSKRYHGGVDSIKLKVVCERRCNNGWMKNREDITKPILVPLILGQPTVLSRESQEKLAAWVVMKTMTAEFSNPENLVTPQADRTSFMETGVIPVHWQVHIAHVQSKKWRTAYLRQTNTVGNLADLKAGVHKQPDLADNIQCVTVGFGELLILIISVADLRFNYEPPATVRRHMRQIWPFNRGHFWPPGDILSESAADVVCMTLNYSTRKMPWARADQAGPPQR